MDESEVASDIRVIDGEYRHLGRFGYADVTFISHLFGVVEEGEEGVIIFLWEGVVFMIMTLGAFDGKAEDTFAKGAGLVDKVFDAVFFGDNAAFFRVFVVSEEGC